MKKTEAKRHQILNMLADHLLEEGLQKASLRQLAAAADMSDRMLLHYFTNKEELLTGALTLVAERLKTILDSAQSQPMPFVTLLPHLAQMIRDDRIQPFMRIWLELVTLAAGGEVTYRQIAKQICDSYLDWIAASLAVKRAEDRRAKAALVLATLEGFVLLDGLGSRDLIDHALEALTMV